MDEKLLKIPNMNDLAETSLKNEALLHDDFGGATYSRHDKSTKCTKST